MNRDNEHGSNFGLWYGEGCWQDWRLRIADQERCIGGGEGALVPALSGDLCAGYEYYVGYLACCSTVVLDNLAGYLRRLVWMLSVSTRICVGGWEASRVSAWFECSPSAADGQTLEGNGRTGEIG